MLTEVKNFLLAPYKSSDSSKAESVHTMTKLKAQYILDANGDSFRRSSNILY